MAAGYERLLPVTLLTGFLGSGKTSLLQRLLAAPMMGRTAVLINELGEIALDHLLIETLDGETPDGEIVVLRSGCVCCTLRTDLSAALGGLWDRRARGRIPAFERVVVETTGLADPAPIVFTLMGDPVIRHHFRLGAIVTTVDAVNGPSHFARQPESVKQVAVADRIALTKTDLCAAQAVARMRQALGAINPTAPIVETAADPLDAEALLSNGVYDPASKTAEVRRWLAAEEGEAVAQEGHAGEGPAHESHGGVSHHAGGIRTFSVVADAPLDWTAFGLWLSMLLHAHGENVLRVKGILNVVDLPVPVVIHGVQHVIHPPVHLPRWPGGDRRSRLIFIVRDLDPAQVRRSLAAFCGLADAPAAAA